MIVVRDNPALHRYEVYDDDHCAGFASYRLSQRTIAFTHTEVEREFTGRGLARRLVTKGLDDARQRGLGVYPFCPYVRRVIALFPEQYLDLVPRPQRERFELPRGAEGEGHRRALVWKSEAKR